MKVYRGTDGDTSPVEFECEEFGYPHHTTDGKLMHENTFFRTEGEAWDSILRSVKAGVNLRGHLVRHMRENMRKAEQLAGDAVAAFSEAHEKYDMWLSSQREQNVLPKTPDKEDSV